MRPKSRPTIFSWTQPLPLILLRVLNAVLLSTYFAPDEVWQHGEIVHKTVFGVGHTTWEWQAPWQIRSWVPLLPSLAATKLLSLMQCDTAFVVSLVPRVVSGVVAGLADAAFARFLASTLGPARASTALRWYLVGSWFSTYCLPRALVNGFETWATTTIIALWTEAVATEHRPLSTSAIPALAALALWTRPSSAVLLGAFVVAVIVLSSIRTGRSLLMSLSKAGSLQEWAVRGPVTALATWAICCAIDSAFYGTFTVPPANFFAFNSATSKGGSALFGTHHPLWYFYSGLPAVLGAATPLLAVGMFHRLRAPMGAWPVEIDAVAVASLASMTSLSCIPHKEFRFLLPLLHWLWPFVMDGMQAWSSKRPKTILPSVPILLLGTNAVLALYTSVLHQRGPLAVTAYLRSQPVDGVHFLAPCHAFPAYSELHLTNASLAFLSCSMPELQARRAPSQAFERRPACFVAHLYGSPDPYCQPFIEAPRLQHPGGVSPMALPSHVVVFDHHWEMIKLFMQGIGYEEDASFFHSHVNGDGDSADTLSRVVVARRSGQVRSGTHP